MLDLLFNSSLLRTRRLSPDFPCYSHSKRLTSTPVSAVPPTPHPNNSWGTSHSGEQGALRDQRSGLGAVSLGVSTPPSGEGRGPILNNESTG